MRSREGAAAAQAACRAGNRADSAAVYSAGESGDGGDMLLQPRQCSSNELTEPSGIKRRKLFVR